jgi:hypothetical protein
MFRVLKQRELADKYDSLSPSQKEKNMVMTSLFDAMVKVKDTIDSIQNSCTHKVVIDADTEPVFGIEQSQSLTICIICGKCIARKN